MRAGGREPAAQGFEERVDFGHVGREMGGQTGQGGRRTITFEFDHMVDQLVGPSQFPHVRVGRTGFAGGGFEHLVGHGQDRQGLAIHDHVFDLDAEGAEKVSDLAHMFKLPVLRRSMRLRKVSTTRR